MPRTATFFGNVPDALGSCANALRMRTVPPVSATPPSIGTASTSPPESLATSVPASPSRPMGGLHTSPSGQVVSIPGGCVLLLLQASDATAAAPNATSEMETPD